MILLIAILGGLVTGCVIIAANGGFMPISPQTASRLVSQEFLKTVALGKRNGNGKDILLLPANTRLVWLSDRFLPRKGFPYQVAFSLRDIVIASGAFWLKSGLGKPPENLSRNI